MPSALLSYGFRPHFLLVGLAGLLLVPLWAWFYVDGFPLAIGWPPTLWHGHEMLFGFVACAMAGFLLTAVPSWTGQKGFAGAPLALLAGTWVLARLLIASSGLLPALVPAIVDLAFMPMLIALVAPPLLRERNRNTPLLLVLIGFWLVNVFFHVALLSGNPPLASKLLHVGVDFVLVLVTVIGGRIVPAFTSSGMRAKGQVLALGNRPWLTYLTVGAMVAILIADAFVPETKLSGVLAAVAAGLQLLRLLQWAGWRTWRSPIIWVLHVAYVWLPVGLALKAIAQLSGAAIGAFWLHALTIGALTTMILAVMTRASLGHTGRPLVVDPLITLAYALLAAACVVRVFGLSLLHLAYPSVIVLTAILWTTAFALFVVVYAPILWRPRVDGRPG